MKTKLAVSCLLAGALMMPIAGFAADPEPSSAKTYVKDSVITTKIKADLAEEKMSSLVQINVDTDNRGMVTLSGSAASQSAINKAISIARAVKGVTSVESQIQIVAGK
jgi:hyperosmotically inducible periplasmic protein